MAEVQTQGFPLLKFSGGLNTEASPVNIEPTDATDIVNIVLGINGGFGPRTGFDLIAEKVAGGFYHTDTNDYSSGTAQYNDPAPAGTVFTTMTATGDLKTFVVLHIGRQLRIYDFTTISSLAEVSTPFQTIDLTSYSDAKCIFYKTKFFNDRNKLIVVNRYIDLGYLYIKLDNTFDFVPITVFERELDTSPTVDSRVNDDGKAYICIKNHTASSTNRPGTGADWKIYWVLYGGEITDLAEDDDNYVNHDWVSGTAYESNVTAVTTEFTTATFSAGRLWLSGYGDKPNTIYFSQTVTDDLFYGRCYQFADPLSDIDSEPVDTDGGTITVNGAERIISLLGFSNGVLVFANNGVWFIGGTSLGEAFKATAFSVEYLSGSGIVGENNACLVEDTCIYFGYGGVYVLTKDDLVGRIKPKSIGDKIQTLYSGLPLYTRRAAKVVYNNSERRLYYFCNLNNDAWNKSYNAYDQSTHFRDCLVFDIRLKAWYKFSLKRDTVGTLLAIGDVFTAQASSANLNFVIDNNNDPVEDASDNLVYSDASATGDAEVANLLVLTKPNGDNLDFAFGKMYNGLQTDFSLDDTEADDFDSAFLSAQLTFQAPIGKKQPPYAYFIFKRMESGVLGESGEDITAGGAFLQIAADWASSTVSGKYSDAIQVYRPNKFTISRYGGISPAVDVVAIKERLRTRGNAIQFKITNDGTKSFYLYGINFLISVTPRI